MKKTILIDLEGDTSTDPWAWVRETLEREEPGSSAHCLELEDTPEFFRARHLRLGVTVKVFK